MEIIYDGNNGKFRSTNSIKTKDMIEMRIVFTQKDNK